MTAISIEPLTTQPPQGPKKPKRSLFKPGEANPGSKARRAITGSGRRKGVKNKFSRDIKESLLNALENLGGDEWFEKLGKREKTKHVLAGLLKGLIPLQVQGGGTGSAEERAAAVREKLRQMEESTASSEPGSTKEP